MPATPHVHPVGDVVAAGITFGALVNALPKVATVLAIIFYVCVILDTETGKRARAKLKLKRQPRKARGCDTPAWVAVVFLVLAGGGLAAVMMATMGVIHR